MIKLKVNTPMLGKKSGDIITLETKSGVIIDQFWRNRLVDSKIDDCVTIVPEKKSKKRGDS